MTVSLSTLSYLLNILMLKASTTIVVLSLEDNINLSLTVVDHVWTIMVDMTTFTATVALLHITISKAWYMKWRIFGIGPLIVFGGQYHFWHLVGCSSLDPVILSTGFGLFELIVLVITFKRNQARVTSGRKFEGSTGQGGSKTPSGQGGSGTHSGQGSPGTPS